LHFHKDVSFTYGTSPNRVHVIQWHSVTPISGTGYLYAAIRLYETSCGTEFDVIHLYGNASSMSATIGCQDATGTDGTQSSLSPNENYPSTTSTNSDDIVYSFSSSNYDYDLSVVVETNLDDVMTVSGTTNLDIVVQNIGAQLVTSFDLNYSINGGITQTDNIITGLNSGLKHKVFEIVVFTSFFMISGLFIISIYIIFCVCYI
jgi:hypothetical protein